MRGEVEVKRLKIVHLHQAFMGIQEMHFIMGQVGDMFQLILQVDILNLIQSIYGTPPHQERQVT